MNIELEEILNGSMVEIPEYENPSDFQLFASHEASQEERPEDLQIIQPDESRACVSYELAYGFHLCYDEGEWR